MADRGTKRARSVEEDTRPNLTMNLNMFCGKFGKATSLLKGFSFKAVQNGKEIYRALAAPPPFELIKGKRKGDISNQDT